MKKVTSITTFETAEGTRVSITYSELSDSGKTISENNRINRIVMDEKLKEEIETVKRAAQEMVEDEA